MTTQAGPVLVGTDGSEQATTAVRWAADEAVRLGTWLHIVHAWVWPLFKVDLGPAPSAPPGAGLQAQADELLASAAAAAREVDLGLRVETSLETGEAGACLVRAAAMSRLVVVGSRGLGGFSGLLLGSVGVEVAAHAPCPVVVVRGTTTSSGPIVVGVDDTEESLHAAQAALEEADRRRAELVLLHAWVPPIEGLGGRPVTYDQLATAGRQRGQDILEKVAGRLPARQEGYPVSLQLTDGGPAADLVSASRTAQLVVAGSRGMGALRGLLLGSTTHALIHHAACPVLVHR